MTWFRAHSMVLQRAFRWLAVATFALTAVQPILGGFSFFHRADSLDYKLLHGIVANTLFPCALLLVALAVVAGFQRNLALIGWSLALLIAVVTQIGLGYSARDDATLLAFHIPAGVAIFTFAFIVALLSFGLTFKRELA